MCGIAGLIGKSKNPDISYKLLSVLLANSEIRGTDATGIYAATHGDNPEIIYHKEPVKSSEFVKGDFWKSLEGLDISMAICHARGASPGSGKPSENANNHPFRSNDYTLGLAHNGKLTDVEISMLNKRYKTLSSCDSELLLRIIEAGADSDELKEYWTHEKSDDSDENMIARINGFRDIWCQVGKGAMTVTLAEVLPENGKRRLWITRNDKRPLWIIDLRKVLGQIFFFSAPEVFKLALKDCTTDYKEVVKALGNKVKLHEFPDSQIWMFELDNDNEHTKDKVFRIQITSSGKTSIALDKLKQYDIKPKEPNQNIKGLRTMLDDKDNVITQVSEEDVVLDENDEASSVKQEKRIAVSNSATTVVTQEEFNKLLNPDVVTQALEMKERIDTFVTSVKNSKDQGDLTDESFKEISNIISDVSTSFDRLHNVMEQ